MLFSPPHGAQVCVAILQRDRSGVVQSALLTHSTQVLADADPGAVSHTFPSALQESEFSHCTQTRLGLQMGALRGQSRSPSVHSTQEFDSASQTGVSPLHFPSQGRGTGFDVVPAVDGSDVGAVVDAPPTPPTELPPTTL